MGWIGTAPRILIFSIAIGADYSYELKNNETWAPAFFKHNNSFIATMLEVVKEWTTEWFQYRNINKKCNKSSCCIVAWSRQTFWFKLNFLLPVCLLKILVYFLEQFQRFSWGLQPLKNLLNCSRIYPKMFSTEFIFRQQENLVNNQKCQAGFRPLSMQQNTI